MIYSEIGLYEMSQNFMCLWNVFLSYEIGGSSFYLGLKYGDQGIKDVAWLPSIPKQVDNRNNIALCVLERRCIFHKDLH